MLKSTVFRSVKELKGFTKVTLAPGEETTVMINLNRRAFAFYDVGQRDWVVGTGDFEILVGASSQDIRLFVRFTFDSGQTATAPVKQAKTNRLLQFSERETYQPI